MTDLDHTPNHKFIVVPGELFRKIQDLTESLGYENQSDTIRYLLEMGKDV